MQRINKKVLKQVEAKGITNYKGMKIALDYLYVGGSQPVILLARFLNNGVLSATVFTSLSQVLLDQFQYICNKKRYKPFWIDFTRVATETPSAVSDYLAQYGFTIVSVDEFYPLLKQDLLLYTTTQYTQEVLKTLPTTGVITTCYLTPYMYHSKLNVFDLTPVSFANSEHNEIVQCVDAILFKYHELRNKFGSRIYAHPAIERLQHQMGDEQYL